MFWLPAYVGFLFLKENPLMFWSLVTACSLILWLLHSGAGVELLEGQGILGRGFFACRRIYKWYEPCFQGSGWLILSDTHLPLAVCLFIFLFSF